VHREIGKRVAVKVLGPAVAAIPGARVRFLREAQLTSRVRHPHIVDLTDMGSEGGHTFLVMEYLEGEDLARRLYRTGAMSPQETADILLPVCAAVIAAHRAGVTHRDLKPQNIFLAAERHLTHPKVLDFGISKEEGSMSASGLTGTGAMIGTPFYLAPEQILDARAAGPASDQYAVGVILFECLTGERVFDGENMFTVFQLIVTGYFTRPRQRRPEIPAVLEEIVLRVMNLDPKARFPSLLELGQSLLPFASVRARTLWEEEFGVVDLSALPSPAAPAAAAPAPPPVQPPALALAPAAAAGWPSSPSAPTQAAEGVVPRPWIPLSATLQAPGPETDGRGDSAPTERVRRKDKDKVSTLDRDLAAAGVMRPFRSRRRLIAVAGGLGAVIVAALVIAAASSSPPDEGEGEVVAAPAPPPPPPPGPTSRRAAAQPLPAPAAARPPAPPAPATYRVSVTADPDTAAIEMDGQAVATGYLERVMPLDHTRHTLRISAAGYEPQTIVFRDSAPQERIRLVRRVVRPPGPRPPIQAAPAAVPAAQPRSDPAPRFGLSPNGAPVID
jgi:serine/threonine-protein kinase